MSSLFRITADAATVVAILALLPLLLGLGRFWLAEASADGDGRAAEPVWHRTTLVSAVVFGAALLVRLAWLAHLPRI